MADLSGDTKNLTSLLLSCRILALHLRKKLYFCPVFEASRVPLGTPTELVSYATVVEMM